MAYTAPLPSALKLRYPAFAAVDDTVVQYWLTDAERFVDTTWREADYAPALMAAAAHAMALQGLGATGAAALPTGVTRFKSASVEVAVSEAAASAQAKGGWGATRYGAEFQAIQRRNFAGPRVVAAGTLP